MKIEFLINFTIFARHLNFSNAARALGITQPTLSHQISNMEKELGIQLVKHGTNPSLTPAGEQFVEGVEHLVQDYKLLVKKCKTTASRIAGTLTIARPDITPIKRRELEGFLTMFRSDIPSVTVKHLHAHTRSLIDLLVSGAVDIGFAYLRPEYIDDDFEDGLFGFSSLPLSLTESVGFCVKKTSPLAACERITIDDILDKTIVFPMGARYDFREITAKWNMASAHISIPIVHKGRNVTEAMNHLKDNEIFFYEAEPNNEGKEIFGTDLVHRPFEGPEWTNEVYAIYRIDNDNRALTCFLDYVDSRLVVK